MGLRVAAWTIGALGVAGAGPVLTAGNLAGLGAGLAPVGATSGAADVAMNSVAGRAERVWADASPTPEVAIDRICQNVGRNLTTEERKAYLPSSDRNASTCPRPAR